MEINFWLIVLTYFLIGYVVTYYLIPEIERRYGLLGVDDKIDAVFYFTIGFLAWPLFIVFISLRCALWTIIDNYYKNKFKDK